MALDSYTALIAAAKDWAKREDGAFSSVVLDCITLTEEMFRAPPAEPHDTDVGGLRVLIKHQTGAIAAGTSGLAKPSDMLGHMYFDLTGSDGGRLDWVAPDVLPLAFREGNGKPGFYTITDRIRLDVASDGSRNYDFSYWAQPTPLGPSATATTTTNEILADYPGVYLAGVLYHAFDWKKDAEESRQWLARYKMRAHAANRAFREEMESQGAIYSQHIYRSP